MPDGPGRTRWTHYIPQIHGRRKPAQQHRRRIWRTHHWTRSPVESTSEDSASGPSGLIDNVPLLFLLREGTGGGSEDEKQCAFHGRDSPFWPNELTAAVEPV